MSSLTLRTACLQVWDHLVCGEAQKRVIKLTPSTYCPNPSCASCLKSHLPLDVRILKRILIKQTSPAPYSFNLSLSFIKKPEAKPYQMDMNCKYTECKYSENRCHVAQRRELIKPRVSECLRTFLPFYNPGTQTEETI